MQRGRRVERVRVLGVMHAEQMVDAFGEHARVCGGAKLSLDWLCEESHVRNGCGVKR